MLLQAEHDDEFGVDDSMDDITTTNISEQFDSLGTCYLFLSRPILTDFIYPGIDPVHDDEQDPFSHVSAASDYAPYPNKTVSRFKSFCSFFALHSF